MELRMPGDRYHEIRLFDTRPDHLDEFGYPRQVAIAGLILNRPREEVLNGPDVNAQLAGAIVLVLSPAERTNLLQGNPYLDHERCCAQCGHNLGLRACSGCGREYQDDPNGHETSIHVPPQVREWFIAQGHVFEQ
jgi:hypothetical protein